MYKVILGIQFDRQFELLNYEGFLGAMIGVQIVHANDIVQFKR